MESGRELDALIAEKVMGKSTAWIAQELKWENHWHGGISSAIPYYSTKIAAAWEVVEKLDEGFTLERYDGGFVCHNTGDLWGAWINNPERYRMLNNNSYLEWAKTAPHAICLAALKAVECTG